MTARILAYAYNGRPAYLPNYDGIPVLTRDVGRSVLQNWQAGRNPQTPDLRETHWGTRAIGWVRDLREGEDGLYAEIELTSEGEFLIVSQRAYGYVSPALVYNLRLPSGEIIDGWSLLHIAATNDPAQYGGSPIFISQTDSGRIFLSAPWIALTPDSSPRGRREFAVEESTMNREELTQVLLETLQPIIQRLQQLEQHIVQLTAEAQQRELERTIEALQREIESWRFEGERVVPPAVARQYAALLARIPEPDRTDALNMLRNNPPQLVKLETRSQPSQPEPEIDPVTRKYLQQLGVSEEAYLKYTKEAS